MSLHSTVKNGHLKIFTYLNPFKLILNYCSFDLLLLVLSKLNYHHRGQLQGTGSQDSGSPSRDFWVMDYAMKLALKIMPLSKHHMLIILCLSQKTFKSSVEKPWENF